jgi:hypothetical protein
MSTNAYSMADIESFVARFWPGRKTFISPYAYPATFTAIAQGGQQTQTINIQANADFLLLGIAFRGNIGAAQNESTITAPFVRMLIVDTGSNEQFTNSAVDLEAMYRNGQRLVSLPYPRIVQGRSALSLQATSYAPTNETYSFDIILEGVHVRAYQ